MAAAGTSARRGRVVLAALALFAAYGLLSLLNDPGAYLGTDTGGKVATLEVMQQRHTHTDVDVGYWAQRWDPAGKVHPYYGTIKVGHRWVQVTSLPMLLAASPLFDAGGYRLALLLPMLGGVLSAFAARALARRFGADEGSQWWAYWLVGLAGPLALYSLDLWEHSLGLAAMAWAVVLLVDAVGVDGWSGLLLRALGAGALFGLASTMRTEALLYAVTMAATAALTRAVRTRDLVRPAVLGAVVLGAVGAAFAANAALERALVGQAIRSARAGGASAGGGADPATRVREGLATLFSPRGTDDRALVLGALLAACLGAAAYLGSRRRSRQQRGVLALLCGLTALLAVANFAVGLAFVPGIAVTMPFAVVGAVAPGRARSQPFVWGALASLPVVFAFQYSGGASAQWGGRYALLSSLVLVVAGITARPRLAPVVGWFVVGASVVVTGYGLLWMSVRTHGVAKAGRELRARSEAVFVADPATQFVPREFAATNWDRRWLSATDPAGQRTAAAVVADAGLPGFALVQLPGSHPPATIGAFRYRSSTKVWFVPGVSIELRTYTRG